MECRGGDNGKARALRWCYLMGELLDDALSIFHVLAINLGTLTSL